MANSDKWSKSRSQSYRVYTISQSGAVDKLNCVDSGSLDWSVFRQVRSGGSIKLIDPPDVDWLSVRIRVSYVYRIPPGNEEEVVLGTYLVSAVDTKLSATGWETTVTLQDTITALVEDFVDSAVSYPAGTVVTDAVSEQLEASYVNSVLAVTESTAGLSVGMAWPAGTSRVKIVNDLLDAINYFAVWADELGTFRVQPYVPPNQRPVVWRFTADRTSVIRTDIDTDQDLHNVYNKVVLTSNSSNDPNSGFVGVAKDEDPNSPFSYPSRGRWVSKSKTGVKATSQQVIDDKAARLLNESRQVVRRDTIRGLWVPLDMHDNAQMPDGSVMSLVERKINLSPGALVTYVFRKVDSL